LRFALHFIFPPFSFPFFRLFHWCFLFSFFGFLPPFYGTILLISLVLWCKGIDAAHIGFWTFIENCIFILFSKNHSIQSFAYFILFSCNVLLDVHQN
jgi:hypothetical protein